MSARALVALHIALAGAVLLLGAAAAVIAMQGGFIGEDGVSYLDVADAFRTNGWIRGLNAYWSPLYPLLLAGALEVVGPSRLDELLVVHAVNFGIFAAGFGAFALFWREIARDRLVGRPAADRRVTLSSAQWWLVGYALFAWCSLRLVKVWSITPDMAVLTVVLVSGTLMVRLRRAPERWLLWILLGCSLAFGYAAKAVMFPLAFVFLAAAFAGCGRGAETLPRLGVSLLTFALLSAPVVLTLSLKAGEWTFGSAGKLNYARFVNGVPDIHWRGESPHSGTPRQSTRILAREPDVYEFAELVGGTYPVWYDPSYWYEGIRAPFDWRRQVAALVRNGTVYADLLLARQGAAIAVAVVLLVGLRRSTAGSQSGWRWHSILAGPALAACSLYSLVYVEERYVAPFLILLWGAALAAIDLPAHPSTRRTLRVGAAVLLAVFIGNLCVPNGKAIAWAWTTERTRVPARGSVIAGSTSGTAKATAARALSSLGLRPGDRVAVIGYSFDAYWARLAGLHIVAEIPAWDAATFWDLDRARQRTIIGTLLSTGARAVVARSPSRQPPDGWLQLGHTGYYVLLGPES